MTARRTASIVVPTRDRPAVLARCLAALDNQADIELEVIVVDDGSADEAGVRAVADRYETTRVVRLAGLGPAAARNAGAAAATGETVLFTDDDCVPESDWAVTLAKAVGEGERGAVGGLAISADDAPAVVVASELIFRYVQERLQLLGTGNLGCRRELVLALPFDERFPLPAGEDREWCSRVVSAGGSLRLEPKAVVIHAPALDSRGFWRQHLRYGRGARRFARSPLGGPLQPVGFYTHLIATGFRHGPVSGGLVLVAQAATAVGYALERKSEGRHTPD